MEQEEIVKWHIQVTSNSNRHGLTNSDIDFVMHCREHPICKKMIKDIFDTDSEDWQCIKSNEIMDKFYKSMFIVFGETIQFKSEFFIMLPESFDEQDVISWTWTYGMTDFLLFFFEVDSGSPKRSSAVNFLKELRGNQIFEVKILK